MGRLTAQVRPRHEIGAAESAAMYGLYARYYDAVSLPLFRSDLADKDFVIELRDGRELKGFSTLAVMHDADAGSAAQVLFSGDTIIERDYWGEQALARSFCRLAGALKAQRPSAPLYWFLISKGYRTYRFLAVFAREYFPHPDRATPAPVQAVIDRLAAARFGAAYSPQLGLVRFARSRGHLKPCWAAIGESARDRAEVRYFLERNPRYAEGEELCCLVALEAENLRSHARKAFVEGLHDERAPSIVSQHRRAIGTLAPLAYAGAGGPGAPAREHPRA